MGGNGRPDAYWAFLQEAAGAVAIVLDRLDEDERSRVGEDVRDRVGSFAGEVGIELPGTSLVLSAS